MDGIILNIARASLHDGPGIRTTVFLKGCGLSCLWCHNPESIQLTPQLFYQQSLCTMCRLCASVCEYDVHTFSARHNINFPKCILCGKCIALCPAKALSIAGKTMSSDSIIQEVLKDKAFYATSGGGLTLSGGEPLGSQIEFAHTLLQSAKDHGISTAIETSGFAPKENFGRVLNSADYFLFDYKVSPNLYKRYTGVSFSIIEANLALLNNRGAHIILRCPIIPTVNDNEEHLQDIAMLADKFTSIKSIELIFYNTFGISKAISIGRENNFNQPMMNTGQRLSYIEKLRRLVSISVS